MFDQWFKVSELTPEYFFKKQTGRWISPLVETALIEKNHWRVLVQKRYLVFEENNIRWEWSYKEPIYWRCIKNKKGY